MKPSLRNKKNTDFKTRFNKAKMFLNDDNFNF